MLKPWTYFKNFFARYFRPGLNPAPRPSPYITEVSITLLWKNCKIHKVVFICKSQANNSWGKHKGKS